MSALADWVEDREPRAPTANLWVIRLAGDGRCRELTARWMEHED